MLSEQDILQSLMKWRTRVSAAAWVVVHDAHASEDIFQNVALKAMTREVSFETESALMSWAFITAPTRDPLPGCGDSGTVGTGVAIRGDTSWRRQD